MPHPGKQVAFLVRVRFPGQRQSLCRLKIEITVDEPILLPVERRWLIHDFDEPLTRSIPVYALAEIVSEKLRALLQSSQRLAERGWGASRVCRDTYDLWWILRQEARFNGQVPDLALRKCAVRQVPFVSPEQFIAGELLEVARSERQQQLLPFAVTAALVQPCAISHWSALEHHGFTTQIPMAVQASTPRKVVTPEMRKGHARSFYPMELSFCGFRGRGEG
jgi:hypothetical protein